MGEGLPTEPFRLGQRPSAIKESRRQMHAIVCIKQVPDTTEVKVNPETGTLIREGVPSIINPFDTYAIEEALLLREKFGGRVTVVSMGPPQAEDALREAIATGADEAILLSDRAFAGADTLATAYTLAEAIQRIGDYDLVICGRQAIDGDTGQVGPGIANRLGIPQLTYVSRIRQVDFENRTIAVERLVEEGCEVVVSTLPAVITVNKDINQPRYPDFGGVIRSRGVEIPLWDACALAGADPSQCGLEGSPTKVVRVFTPPPRQEEAEIIEADTVEEAAALLAEKLLAEEVI
jgi:electron transfer flavoprotein alpha/beta subunit